MDVMTIYANGKRDSKETFIFSNSIYCYELPYFFIHLRWELDLSSVKYVDRFFWISESPLASRIHNSNKLNYNHLFTNKLMSQQIEISNFADLKMKINQSAAN